MHELKSNATVAMNLSARLHPSSGSDVKFLQFASNTPSSTGGNPVGGGLVTLLQGTGIPASNATMEAGVVSVAVQIGGSANLIAQPVTVNTTLSQTVQLTLTCAGNGTGSNTNTVTLRQLHVLELN